MPNYLKFCCLVLILSSISSCEATFGDKYTIDNFEIYFTEQVSDKYVVKTAEYFKENGLIQDRKHSAQLSFDDATATFKLKLILNNKYDKLPADMIDDLLLLEEDMRTVIFEDLNFELVVCDEEFNPIK